MSGTLYDEKPWKDWGTSRAVRTLVRNNRRLEEEREESARVVGGALGRWVRVVLGSWKEPWGVSREWAQGRHWLVATRTHIHIRTQFLFGNIGGSLYTCLQNPRLGVDKYNSCRHSPIHAANLFLLVWLCISAQLTQRRGTTDTLGCPVLHGRRSVAPPPASGQGLYTVQTLAQASNTYKAHHTAP